MIRDGKWVHFETTVCWLEVDPEDPENAIEVVKTFESIEERQEYLEERINTGMVYDLLWHTESSYGGDRRGMKPIEETVDNGFVPTKGRDREFRDSKDGDNLDAYRERGMDD